MASLTIDLTGKAGLAKKFFGDVNRTVSTPNLRYDAKDRQMAEGIYNPFNKNGYLSPLNGTLITMETPSITQEFSCVLVDPDGSQNIYFSERDQKTYKGQSIIFDVQTHTYDSFDVVKFEQAFSQGNLMYDTEKYEINGSPKFFYATSVDVGIADPGFGSNNNTWLSTTATGAFTINGVANGYGPLLRKADNGFMYILDGYAVHKIDGTATGGTNGSATQNVMVFPQNFNIMDGLDYKGTMLLALNSKPIDSTDKTFTNFVGVYVWDRLSTVSRVRDFVQIPDAKEIRKLWLSPSGQVRVMTVATNNLINIKELSSGVFKTIAEFPAGARLTRPDGMTIAEGLTIWAGTDGYLYAHGSNDDAPEGSYKLIQYYNGTLSTEGGTVIAYAGGDSFAAATGYNNSRPSIYIAYKPASGNAVIKKWYIHGTGTITDTSGDSGGAYVSPVSLKGAQGDVYTPVKYLPRMSTLRDMTIYCAPGTTSDSTVVATIKLYRNQSATPFLTKSVTKAMITKGYVYFTIDANSVNAIQVEIEWSTENTLGDDDFCPSVAILTYEPTNTKLPTKD